MKTRILSLALALAPLAGCATKTENLTTTRIDVVHGTNRVSLVNPKDVSMDKAEIPTPYGPAVITGYRSSANEAAIHAAQIQAQAQLQMFERFETRLGDKLDRFVNRAASMYGIPDAQPTRREVVILTNAPLVVLTNAAAAK